jgi:hypothetical protein
MDERAVEHTRPSKRTKSPLSISHAPALYRAPVVRPYLDNVSIKYSIPLPYLIDLPTHRATQFEYDATAFALAPLNP